MNNEIARHHRQDLILSFGFLLSLVTLIVNDHWLKNAYPSLITGKLSDFAGLIVLPVLLCALIPRIVERTRHLVGIHVAIGFLFVLWKLAPVELITDRLNELVGFDILSRVKDPTDLIALVSLFASFLIIMRGTRIRYSLNLSTFVRTVISAIIISIASLAVMATSVPFSVSDEIECCEGIRGNVDNDELNEITISDLIILIDFIFNNAPRPDCLAAADVNGSGDKNPIREDDVWYLIDYMFRDGPPPPDCPASS